jgi:YgiT-type zinc finger domain-containing protein
MSEAQKETRCPFCGHRHFETYPTEYLYSFEGKYLLVPDTPVMVCTNCGMVYYDAAVLEAIEQHFFAIQQEVEEPDTYIQMPLMVYA